VAFCTKRMRGAGSCIASERPQIARAAARRRAGAGRRRRLAAKRRLRTSDARTTTGAGATSALSSVCRKRESNGTEHRHTCPTA
jgi:hypothetical protein